MRSLLIGFVAVLAGGCATSVREARATQPNPARALQSTEELPRSVRLYIHQRDMNLPRDFQLRSWAEFVVVTRERVRFHVGIVRADEREAETKGWRVHLEDETGRRYQPDGREGARVSRIAMNWRLWPFRPSDSWCPNPPCLSRAVPGFEAFEGQADYAFRDPRLLRPERKLLRLVMRRGDLEYRFTWRFGDVTAVEHYGRSRSDRELGVIVVPGPHTDVASTRYESETW
jgi:hypothetical protein